MIASPNPIQVAGGTAGPSEAYGRNTFNFSTGAFGAEPASNQLIKVIVPLSALGLATYILWRVLK